MLEIMLSKLHVTSLCYKRTNKKEKRRKKKTRSASTWRFFLKGKKNMGESRGLFLRSGNLGYVRQKAKEREKNKSTRGVKCEGK